MDLKQRARERGIKQKDLADRHGVSEGTMSKWLNGDVTVPTKHLRLLAQQLDIVVDDILPQDAAE